MWANCKQQRARPVYPFRYHREQYRNLEEDRNFWKLVSVILIMGLIVLLAAFLWALGPV